MSIHNISIQISADNVAWYGAIVATGALLVSTYNIWQDRARIRIKYQKGMRMINSAPPYSDDKDYFIITIINKGRRPVAIGNVAVRLFNGKAFIAADSLNNANRILTEEKPVTQIMIDQNELDFSKTYYIEAYDKTGRRYKKYFYRFSVFKKIIFLIKNNK